ncbi:uncharacterized protein LOC128468331 [Spea bombifrons]|uniref:uncharacterized protein LOC128468331 n=1 Tax=Spea bombifrons TaxID=233779 RepID=UPI00234BA923|nr:uncharacterized protein LOC128468331 [Spea bombifrons]
MSINARRGSAGNPAAGCPSINRRQSALKRQGHSVVVSFSPSARYLHKIPLAVKGAQRREIPERSDFTRRSLQISSRRTLSVYSARDFEPPAASRSALQNGHLLKPLGRKMFVKKRNSLSDANEIKRGSLIKSPPSYIFNNRSSWKVRLFKLFQTRDNKFILSYYEPDGVSEKMKGTIKIRNIKSIKKEYNSENVSAILRSFNISHHKVIHVKTEDRDFYLCDEIEEELDDWYECLTNAWIKENTSMDISGPKILHPKPPSASSETLNDDRPKSYPENYPKSGNQLAEANERERSHTDPGVICKPSPTASQQQKIECTDRSTIPLPDHPQPVKLNTKCSARPPPLQVSGYALRRLALRACKSGRVYGQFSRTPSELKL